METKAFTQIRESKQILEREKNQENCPKLLTNSLGLFNLKADKYFL